MSLLVLAASIGLAAAPAGNCTPVELVDGRVWVRVDINGIETEALLDSGAEMSVLDAGFAASLGAGMEGAATARGSGAERVEASFMPGADIVAGGVTVQSATVAVIDLSEVADRLIGRPLPMILGREIFDASRLLLDFDNAVLCTLSRNEEPDGRRLPLEPRAGIMAMPVEIEGHAVLADFDIGNRGELLLTRSFAETAGLYDGRAVAAATGGGLGGAVERDRLVVEELDLAGFRHSGVMAEIQAGGENEAPANVGLGVLSRYRIVVDYAEEAVWLEPGSGTVP